MRNTLTIQSSDICECVCIDNVDDGTNSIYLDLDVKNATNPKLKIYKNGALTNTIALTPNQSNLVVIPASLYVANAIITFSYSDDSYVGNTFTINFPDKLEGNMMVTKESDYGFNAKYRKSGSIYDDALSTTSENAVQNKVVTAALNNKQNKLTIDSALSTTSTNPVQNKVVTAKLKESVKGSTTFKSASGSSSSVPTVDISAIPVLTKLHIEVGVAIDTSGTVAYFPIEVIKPSKDYLYQIGGYYYSANYNGSLFINVSDKRVTINESWSKIVGGSGAATVPLKATTTKLYVYTENL